MLKEVDVADTNSTENRPNELSNFKFYWQIQMTSEGWRVLRSAMQMRKSKSERIHDRELVHTNQKDWWPIGFNLRLRHGIFRCWIITEFMDRKQTWMHLISNYRYIIRKNHKIVTFIIRLHVLIGGRGSCVLVAHATSGKTKSLLSR
jgi:predicted exporter